MNSKLVYACIVLVSADIVLVSASIVLVKQVHQHGFAGLSVSRPDFLYASSVLGGKALFLLVYFNI